MSLFDFDILSRSIIDSLAGSCAQTQPSGVLITGPSGSGKTFLTNHICSSLSPCFSKHYLSCADLINKEVGHSEKALRDVFHRAVESAPAIIVMDGLDLLLHSPPANAAADAFERERWQGALEASLLALLDKHRGGEHRGSDQWLACRERCVCAGEGGRGGVLLLATALSTSSISACLLCVHRLEEHIPLALPSPRRREAFIFSLLEKFPLLLDSGDGGRGESQDSADAVRDLVALTDQWTFGEMRELFTQVLMQFVGEKHTSISYSALLTALQQALKAEEQWLEP